MDSIELKAPAKLNLSLDVLGKRPDGYHELRMIMQTIGLCDTVTLEVSGEGIEVSCNSPFAPSGSGNIAYKAAALLMEACRIDKGIKIRIDKKIPVAAGLGGGSSDAAAVLKGMNALFSLGRNPAELAELGKQIGADVPYFIKGGTVLAEGIGEVLTELDRLADVDIVLVMPRFGVSTAWVYKNLVLEDIHERPDTDLLIRAVRERKLDVLARNMRNVLETVTIKKHGIIAGIKKRLLELGALGSMMSGSGPSVFGIFGDKQSAQRAWEKMRQDNWQCFLTHTV